MVEPVFGEAADLEILDQHIGAGDEGADLLLPTVLSRSIATDFLPRLQAWK